MKISVLIAALMAATVAMTDASAQTVNYDTASTTLTVRFQSNSQGGTVEVYHDDEKVAGITANSGTTFSCILREYGEGNYNVIVSNGNTVIDAKKYTVKQVLDFVSN